MARRWLQAPPYNIGLAFVLGVVVVKLPFKLWRPRPAPAEEDDLG